MEDSQSSTSQASGNAMAMPIAIVIAGVFIAGGLYFGLNGNTSSFTDQSNRVFNDTNAVGQAGQPSAAPTIPTNATVSVDNDPVLGNPDAPVTVIEFSDYECPFCQRSFQTVMPELKKNYIDTGKVKFVYRDFPLPMHDPAATDSAMAANCAFIVGGSATYYSYHDKLWPKLGAVSKDVYTSLAGEVGVNALKFQECLNDRTPLQAEIDADMQAGSVAGVSGTPTFFVGKSSADGNVNAEIVIGAVPYAQLETVIKKYL